MRREKTLDALLARAQSEDADPADESPHQTYRRDRAHRDFRLPAILKLDRIFGGCLHEEIFTGRSVARVL